MSEDTPKPDDKPTAPPVAPASDPFAHLAPNPDVDVERIKAEFRARMAESSKRWKKKAKRRQG